MENLSRELIFKFKDREYKIEFPTVGQFLDIENEKLMYSRGNWGGLVSSVANSSYRAVQLIECIANLKILCPQLFKDLKEGVNILDIDAKDFASLFIVYKKQIKPWYSSWFKEFNDILQEDIDIDKEE